jgi:DNA-binding IclR family transcriptional regulator
MASTTRALKSAAAEPDAEPQAGGREVAVPAVTRAAAMLRLLSTSPIPLGVNQIARELDVIPSTCLHILRALAAEGLVAVDPITKRYRLGLQVVTLAKAALRESIGERAQPYLDELVRKYGVTAIAVSASGPDHYVVTALSHASSAIRLHVDLGSRFPALISATGRCVAAYSNIPRSQLKAQFERLRWHDAPSFEQWEAEVAEVRARGYAIDNGNYISGVSIIAAPVLGEDGYFRHGIVSVSIRDSLQDLNLEALADDVKMSADSLSSP